MRRETWLALVALAACSPAEPDDVSKLPPAICNTGSSFSPGVPAFRDATAEWGLLDGLRVTGVRLNAVDIDGDGWPDLTIRAGIATEDPSDDTRTTHVLRNNAKKRFIDETLASGVLVRRDGGNTTRPGPTWVWGDVNGDGTLDLFTGLPDAGSDESESSELLLGEGGFSFRLADEGNAYRTGIDQPFGASFVDVDLDGHLDLWVTNGTANSAYQQDHLYLGDGAGGFTRQTGPAGLITRGWSNVDEISAGLAHSSAWAAAACDLTGDGYAELLASSYGRAPNHLWVNDGAGKFTNHSVASGYAYDHRTDWTDNESARCWCTLNPNDAECAGVPAPTRINCQVPTDAFRWNHTFDRNAYRLGGNSGQTVCADLDNDGDLDLLTTEIVHWDVGSSSDPAEILVNSGESPPRFTRPGNEATGLVRTQTVSAWNDGDITAEVFDFDNDGWPDIFIASTDYPGTRGLLYHQVAPLQFVPVSTDDSFFHPRAHGTVVADFDRDGDLDMVVGHSSARCDADCWSPDTVRFYENLSEKTNFIQVRLTGTYGSNTAAIGARVRVTAGGVTQTQDVSGGGGQWGDQSDLVLHFGLGSACEAEIEVAWPDRARTVETYTVGSGYRYQLTQGGEIDVIP